MYEISVYLHHLETMNNLSILNFPEVEVREHSSAHRALSPLGFSFLDMVKDFGEAVTMYESGKSIGEIARHYGITRQAMWAILRRRDVLFRTRTKTGEENHFYTGSIGYSKRAHSIVETAVRNGTLIKQPCEVCGSAENIRAHHDDYNKPLEVRWLCQRDHLAWHKTHEAIRLIGELPVLSRPEICSLGGRASARKRNGRNPKDYATLRG
jgi:transposase-like protein